MRCRAVEILSQPQTHTHNARSYARIYASTDVHTTSACTQVAHTGHAHSARRPQMHANRPVRQLLNSNGQLHVENEKIEHSANFKTAKPSESHGRTAGTTSHAGNRSCSRWHNKTVQFDEVIKITIVHNKLL